MKIDHLVVNVDRTIQEDKEIISSFHSIGLPYNPKWGKGTKGFKVSNIWIGDEYFEFVRIKRKDGGGWIQDWTTKYNNGHRGLIGFAIEVDDIQATYSKLIAQKVDISPPEPLKFRWFFNLLTRTMPWHNAYLPSFQGVPFQFFLQQMNDEKAKQFMQQYMVPNSRDNEIQRIAEVKIYGQLTTEDKAIIYALFDNIEEKDEILTIKMEDQSIQFVQDGTYKVEVILECNNEQYAGSNVDFNNVHIINR
ncbi:MAG: VOC family protein [Candidatus Pristimantibacillus lignocellulolyticus]|uniref:VOC family protein n=1 Tax=Candidatus Pristimantibacillus lignocellulolyticus TaxID=2994561 RepID=A0A9J6ZCL7_9BACL|nr:MAG: VOC family protein [Candidatus Pristimantibacillus lignocellulolyticus]